MADERPATRPDLVVNTATGENGAAVGSRVNIYGWGIALRPEATRVLFDGVEARVVGVDIIGGSELVMAIVPGGLRGKTSAKVVVVSGDQSSDEVDVAVKDLQPGIYPLRYSASPGGRLTLLASGIGDCNRAIAVALGGQPAPLDGCSESQWYPGAWELTVTAPATLNLGEQTVALRADGETAPEGRVHIE
jgi:hypothetical protein